MRRRRHWRPTFRTVAALLAAAGTAGALSGPAVPASATARPSVAGSPSSGFPSADPASAAERQIAAKLAARLPAAGLGDRTAVLVRDLDSGGVVWGRAGTRGLMPASTTKLATAVAALTTFPPTHRFRTEVRAGGEPGTVVLVGGGDPSLTSTHLARLAEQTAARLQVAGVSRVRLYVDDSRFAPPRPAPGWQRGYHPHTIAPVRALIVDKREVTDTGLDAARLFAAQLRRNGVVAVVAGRTRVSTSAPLLAEVEGEPLERIVRDMLGRSDNDIAEHLFRQVALRTGYPADWAGAAAAERSVLARLGVPLEGVKLYDGSGLSRSNRLTPAALVHLLALAASPDRPELRAVYVDRGMAVAGSTGTLAARRGRFTTAPSSCARGKVVAKTGTLRDVVALAGITPDVDGRLKAFAILVNGPAATLGTRRKVDALAATVTGCW